MRTYERYSASQDSINKYFLKPITHTVSHLLEHDVYHQLQIRYYNYVENNHLQLGLQHGEFPITNLDELKNELYELVNTLNQLKDSIPYMNKLFIALGQVDIFYN